MIQLNNLNMTGNRKMFKYKFT